MQQAYIVGAGKCLPNRPVTNQDLESVLGSTAGAATKVRNRIIASTGILSRHLAIDPLTRQQTHNNAAMSADAVRDLCSQYDLPMNVDLLCCGTSSPDQLVPSHGQMVHGALKTHPLEVMTSSGVCVSGVSALKHAFLAIKANAASRAIAVGSDLVSNLFRAENFAPEAGAPTPDEDVSPIFAFHSDFLRWVLSDGAGALYLANEPAPGRTALRIDWIDVQSFSNELETCMYSGGRKGASGELIGWRDVDPKTRVEAGYFKLSQDVRLLNEKVVPVTVGAALPRVMQRYDLRPSQVDWFLPHYSSAYFRAQVHDCLIESGFPLPYEKWFTNLDTRGNTGAASIYLMIEEMLAKGMLKSGNRILCYVPESARFAVGYMHLTVV